MSLLSRLAGCALAMATALPAIAVQVGVHEPVMVKEGGKYYLFSTGPGITFYSSTDMRSWKPEGRVFPGEPACARKAAPGFGGKDYMVLHAYESADKFRQKLKVLDMTWDADGWPVVDAAALNRYTSV